MRKRFFALVCSSILLFALVLALEAPLCKADVEKDVRYQDSFSMNWTVETVDDDVDVGFYSSIVLDSSNTPHILYQDSRYNRMKQAEKVGGDHWDLDLVHSRAVLASYSGLDIDSRDRLHTALNAEFYYNRHYGIRENGSWRFHDIPGSHYADSIAVDPLDRPHIGSVGPRGIYHMFYNGTEWKIEEVEKIEGDTLPLGYASIEVDSKSRVHLSYARFSPDKALRYALWDGNQWHLETVDYIDTPSSIAVTSDGVPHILYYGPQSCGCLRHAFKEGNSWKIHNLLFASMLGYITVDSLDRPHIVFMYSGTLGYAFQDENSWKFDYVDKAKDVQDASVFLDSRGYPHISYYDARNNNLMYATVSRPAISADVDIAPDALNLQSRGRWITGYIELEEGYDVRQINASTILLNDTVHPVLDIKYGFVGDESSYIVDHDGDGILERMVKFNRIEVEKLLSPGDPVPLTITGQLYDGTEFEGSDKMKVIDPTHLIQSRFSYISRPRDNDNLVRSDCARNVVVGRLSRSDQVLDSFKTYPSRLFGRA